MVQSIASNASWEVMHMMPMLKLCSHQTDHCWPQTSHSLNPLTLVPWLFSPVAWRSCDWCGFRICSKYSVARADTPWQSDPQSCSTDNCGRRVGDNPPHDVPYPGIGSRLFQLLPLQRSLSCPKTATNYENPWFIMQRLSRASVFHPFVACLSFTAIVCQRSC